MSNSKMKNLLAENMQRFGTKNLSDSDKHKLTLLTEQMPAAYAQAQRNQDVAQGKVATPPNKQALQVTTGKPKNDNTPVFRQDKYNVVTGKFKNPIPDAMAILVTNDEAKYFPGSEKYKERGYDLTWYFNGVTEWSTSNTPGPDGKPSQTIYGKSAGKIIHSYSTAEPGVIRDFGESKDGLYDWNSTAWKNIRTNFQALGDFNTSTIMRAFPTVFSGNADELLNKGSQVFKQFDQFAKGLISKITLKNPNYR